MKYYLFLIATFLCSVILHAQGLIETEPSKINIAHLDSKDSQLNLLNTTVTVEVGRVLNVASGNTVFIEQIGTGNTSSARVSSSQSEVNLLQRGGNNSIQLDLESPIIDYNVLQNGNTNSLREYSSLPSSQGIQRKINQSGNGQNLIIHGNNSLSNRMEIDMGQGSQSLIIRNLN